VRVVVVGCGPGRGRPVRAAGAVLARTTLQAEPDLRRLLGGSHTPAG
jgi:hypothetical protein